MFTEVLSWNFCAPVQTAILNLPNSVNNNVDERSLSMYKRARLLSLCCVMVERKYFLSRRILKKLRYAEAIFFSWISLPGQCPGMPGPRYAYEVIYNDMYKRYAELYMTVDAKRAPKSGFAHF